MVFWLSVIYIVLAMLHIGDWTLRHVIIPYFIRKRSFAWLDNPAKQQAYNIFHALYENVRAKRLAQTAVRQFKLDKKMFTYGEIDFISFGKLLEIAKPQPGEHFVDLGSGSGKAVLATTLLYPQCTTLGVELIATLYELSMRQVEKYKTLISHLTKSAHTLTPIRVIQQDILQSDFSHANIVFINATCYNDAFMDALQQRLRHLADGSRVIITTKTLNVPGLVCIDHRVLLMSWGQCRCRIYKKCSTQDAPDPK